MAEVVLNVHRREKAPVQVEAHVENAPGQRRQAVVNVAVQQVGAVAHAVPFLHW